jgi:Flp pilus assembly protein TadG
VNRTRSETAVSSREHGAITVQFVLATAFSFVLLVLVANLLVDLYARGAVRDALDEGARAGALAPPSVAACEREAAEALDSLLRGRLGRDVTVECERNGDGWVRATARVRLASWLPGVPDWVFTMRAIARERT